MSSRQSGKDINDKNEKYSQRRKPRKKVCQFCQEKATHIDYKDLGKLKKYTTERGKILPRRITGAARWGWLMRSSSTPTPASLT